MPSRRTLIRTAALALYASRASAQINRDPEARQFVARFLLRLNAILAEPGGGARKRHDLESLIRADFDLAYFAHTALFRFGPVPLAAAWNRHTPSQSKRFESLALRYLQDQIVDLVGTTPAATFQYEPQSSGGSGVGTLLVRPNQPPIDLHWEVSQPPDELRIIDILLAGTSASFGLHQKIAALPPRLARDIDVALDALDRQIPS